MTKQDRGGYNIDDQYGMYFVTFTVVGWVDLFTRLECKNILISSLRYCQESKGLNIHAYVIMPSHIHLILSARPDSQGLSSMIREYKSHTAKELIKWIESGKVESRREWLKIVFAYEAKYNKRNSKYQIWIQDNQPKACLHPKFIMRKINYIHNNPVESGIVSESIDYLYSSARDYNGMTNDLLEADLIDFGVQEGYVF